MSLNLRQLLRWTTSETPAIGVDLGHEGVRMLQLEGNPGRPPAVIAAARRDVRSHRRRQDGGEAMGQLEASLEAVKDLLRCGRFEGKRVVAAIPRSIPQVRTLRLNITDPHELPRLLAREARTTMGLDVTNGRYIVHFLPGDTLRRGAETHQEGLLVIVRKRDVEQFVVRLHDCGAQVAAIDLEPLALYRSVQRFSRRRRDVQDVQVIVDIGTRSTQVVIGRGTRISFHKSISIGTESLHAAIARKLDLSAGETAALCRKLEQQVREASRRGDVGALDRDPLHRAAFTASRATVEDLARELSLCLRYYCVTFRCKRPERVLVCGAAAEDPRLCSALSAALPVIAEPRRPLNDLRIPDALGPVMEQFPEEWTTALGLSLRFAPAGLAGKAGLSRDVQAVSDDLTDLESEIVAAGGSLPGVVRHPQEPVSRRTPSIGSLEELSNA
jgi:Tfp pilus assembly PilM family ATPase